MFNLKKGAVFGIDARITFAVTAIAAFIVGINQLTEINRNAEDKIKLDLREIKNSFLKYYEKEYVTPTVATLINSDYLAWSDGNFDPWGNPYTVNIIANNEIIGKTIMSTKYVTLFSLGKNGVKDSVNPTDSNNWKLYKPTGDDVILKFTTKEIEKKIAEIETNQLTVIEYLLNNYIASKKQELAVFCSSNPRNLNCDVNEDKIYDENEEAKLNFMPKNIDDSAGKYYLVKHSIHGTNAEFKSGYINTSNNTEYNMYSFMSQIGGNSEFVKSPRNLVLHFLSNKFSSTDYPYAAEIWYDTEKTVF